MAEPCGAVACGDRVRASAFLLGCEEGVLGVTGTTGAAATEVGGLPRLICTWGAEGGIVGGAWAWTCLLYTSPSPRDISGSRMPSSA